MRSLSGVRQKHVTEGTHASWVRENLFPTTRSALPLIGAEVELLAFDAETRDVSRLDGRLGAWLRAAAASGAWTSENSTKGAPKYHLPEGGCITLEPGGQVEYSSVPRATPRALIDELHTVLHPLTASAHEHGITLHAVGIDPVHALEAVPLQLHGERYARMDAYLRTIGDAGPRMMRQTAAIQVSVNVAHDPARTWRVLNRAAPVLTALFANSRRYAGRFTRYASYRAQAWRELDGTRTGVIETGSDADGDRGLNEIVAAYTDFATCARVIADAPHYRPFNELSNATSSDFAHHLTTLFPEVRPNRYYEVRCMDSIPIPFVAAPILLVAALAWDEETMAAAGELLDVAYNDLLLTAARDGMSDPQLRIVAHELVSLAVEACERAGASFASSEDVEALRAWLQRSLAPRGAPFEDDFVGNDHVADDAVAGLGK